LKSKHDDKLEQNIQLNRAFGEFKKEKYLCLNVNKFKRITQKALCQHSKHTIYEGNSTLISMAKMFTGWEGAFPPCSIPQKFW
jgi:hypothetical protein